MQALWSEHWHAVRHARLALRDGVQVVHRRLRGRPWVLLIDPVTQRFHRVTPKVWSVLARLDGRLTLDEVWARASEALPPGDTQVISQDELVQLMASLHRQDLLRNHQPPDAAEVQQRHDEQRAQQRKQRWANPMSLRWALWHPDAWFDRQAGLARRVFGLPMALLWLALVLPAAVLGWQHLDALTDNLSDRVLSASNLALLWLVYPVVKAVHEWAHGLAVKAWGGRVREMGIMFILFTPVPYVDASASYRFHSKWARAAVAAAGIAAELALGALALYVWLAAQDGLVRALAFNVVLIAGFSTLVVNGNPLMRYDGYFIACDLLELPNLAQRAAQYRRYLIDRWLLGAHEAAPPVGVAGERGWLLAYGLLAPLYQLSVTLGVIWFVVGEYLLLGALMALMALWTSVVMPLWRGWRHLHTSPALAQHRAQAWRRAWGWGGLVLGGLALLPLPFHVVHQGVVWVPDAAIVRAQADGHVRQVLPHAGQALASLALVMQLDNPPLVAEAAAAAAELQLAQVAVRQAQVQAPAKVAGLQQVVAAREARWQEAMARQAGLQVHTAMAGHWAPAGATAWEGRHVRRGDILGHLVDQPSRRVRVAVTQEDMGLVGRRLQAVQVRPASPLARPLLASLPRLMPGGEQTLVSPALGTAGGGQIPVDPADPDGRRTLQRVFDLEIDLLAATPGTAFGQRVDVRFDLGHLPLLWQWGLRARQVFLARLGW